MMPVGKEYFNLTDMTEEELNTLRSAIEAEKRCRANRKEKAWEAAIAPLREYCKKYPLTIHLEDIEYTYEPADDWDFDKIFYDNGPGVICTGVLD